MPEQHQSTRRPWEFEAEECQGCQKQTVKMPSFRPGASPRSASGETPLGRQGAFMILSPTPGLGPSTPANAGTKTAFSDQAPRSSSRLAHLTTHRTAGISYSRPQAKAEQSQFDTRLSPSPVKTQFHCQHKPCGLPKRRGPCTSAREAISTSSNDWPCAAIGNGSDARFDTIRTESPVEMPTSQEIEWATKSAHDVKSYPELNRYRHIPPAATRKLGVELPYRILTHDLPPTPLHSGTSSLISGLSGSFCTRFGESPVHGPSSRDTTPTSMSSQSPSLCVPIRLPAPRMRLPDPRPPVTRRRAGSLSADVESPSTEPQGLATLRESIVSSSSNSTVREGGMKEIQDEDQKLVKLPPLPPSPTPRKSSQSRKNSRNEGHLPPTFRITQPTRQVAAPVMLRSQPAARPKPVPPKRPSRDGIDQLHAPVGLPVPIVQSNLTSTCLSEKGQSRGLAPSQSFSKLPPSREPSPMTRIDRRDQNEARSRPERATRTPSPVISNLKSRFSLFGRKPKMAADDVQTTARREERHRKGPAAGTGHEGYGRLGAVRRSSSSSVQVKQAIKTKSSQESLGGVTVFRDPFLMDRMAPLVIAGGEVVHNRNPGAGLSRTTSRDDSKNSSRTLPACATPWSPALPTNSTKTSTQAATTQTASSSRSHRQSDSCKLDNPTTEPSLALRRRTQRFDLGNKKMPRIPTPILTNARILRPSTSSEASIMSDDKLVNAEFARERKTSGGACAPAVRKMPKRAPSPRKRTFFGRFHNQLAAAAKKEKDVAKICTVAAAVTVLPTESVAFYNIKSSEHEDKRVSTEFEGALREARRVRDASTSKGALVTTHDPSPQRSLKSNGPAHNLDSSRIKASDHVVPARFVQDLTERPASAAAPWPPDSGRPSRLPSAGCIPRVGMVNPKAKLPRSFSRPFNRMSFTVSANPRAAIEDAELGDSLVEREGLASQVGLEFPTFSPLRKNSECTMMTTSSSSGMPSFADATAIIPTPDAPLDQDEIWDEYDDLFGSDTIQTPPSAGSSMGQPFHLEDYSNRLARQAGNAIPRQLPNMASHHAKSLNQALETAREDSPTSSHAQTLKNTCRPNDPQPPSPTSVRSRPNSASSRRNAGRSVANSGTPGSDDMSPVAQVNLRICSLTVSKWLTFGHVLFSPIGVEMALALADNVASHFILIVDGLGNDDWSFYAAETYPAVSVFNLSPRPSSPKDCRTASSFLSCPENHHQIQYVSHNDRFPFCAESFASVVYRFPSASPEPHYRNVVHQARSVLKPGGFFEACILDIDLNNMGLRGRRAIRRLKERIYANGSDVYLGSASDLILRLLGSHGFTDIRTCRVGIPIVSLIGPFSATSKASASARNPGPSPASTSATTQSRSKNDNSSLVDRMSDEGITKMLAKVGRWWYSRCYEDAFTSPSGLGAGSNKSLWDDQALLAECEERASSFKLMVCHARVPDGKRLASI